MTKQPQPEFNFAGYTIRYKMCGYWMMLNVKDLTKACNKNWKHWLKLKKTQKLLKDYSEILSVDGSKVFITDENGDEYVNFLVSHHYADWANFHLYIDMLDWQIEKKKYDLFMNHKEDTVKRFKEAFSSNPCFMEFSRRIKERIDDPEYTPIEFWENISVLLENDSEYLRENVELCLDYFLFNELTDLTKESTQDDIRLHHLLICMSSFHFRGIKPDLEKLFNWLSVVCPELIRTCRHLYTIR